MNFVKAAEQAGLTPQPGKQAMQKMYRTQIVAANNINIVGSIDLDAHFKKTEPNNNRWDYSLGFSVGRNNDCKFVIHVEPHPASNPQEIDTVIKKLRWLRDKLKLAKFSKLASLTKATYHAKQFCWLYSGQSSFKVGSKEHKLLAQAGIELPKRTLKVTPSFLNSR
ncbi:MAG: hypothetical protein ACR2PR_04785 [Pseudohongiellaceae bacterium]